MGFTFFTLANKADQLFSGGEILDGKTSTAIH
jgi:hypothetical protein